MSLATLRRAARERALGLLYEAEAKGTTGTEVLAALPVPADDFAVALVEAVDEHRERIDALLERFAQGWTLARMPALDRAALRMGSAELIARPDVPTGVVLAETVELASRFSTDASGRFVNGLLARIAEEVRGHGAATFVADAGAGGGDDAEPPLEPEVDGLIIDLDGVIRHWDPAYGPQVDARLGIPEGTLTAVALEEDRLARVVDGRLTFEGWCEEIGAEIEARHGVAPSAAADAWATSTWQIDLDVMDLVAAVREVVPVALLSNASTHLLVDLELCGIADAFDAAISSADIRAAKPSRAAFVAAAERLGVDLERVLYIDDTPGHVEAARALGMRAALFTGVDELRAQLAAAQLVR
jgi:putative hydrolase of the HAD superfamily